MLFLSDILRKRLPPRWRVTERNVGSEQARSVLEIVAPDGRSQELIVLRRNQLEPRTVLTMQMRQRQGDEVLPDLVVAPYLSPEVRRRLREAEVGFVDETGNLYLSLAEPGLFIESMGANKNPNPSRRSARSLAGAKAGRIVRVLCERRAPWGVRELAAATGVSPGYVSRLLSFLDREALVQRDDKGRIIGADWRRLVRRWAEAAPLETRGRCCRYVAPRGLSLVMRRLAEAELPHAVTGSFAAARIAPVAPPRMMTLYVARSDDAQRVLDLREADIGTNVLLIEPRDRSVLSAATVDEDGARWAPVVQVAADLLTSPGRGPVEADALMEWMAMNEDAWRA